MTLIRNAARAFVGRLSSLVTTKQIYGDEAGPDPAARGFYWVHLTPYLFLHLACLGVIWDMRPVPAHALERGRTRRRTD